MRQLGLLRTLEAAALAAVHLTALAFQDQELPDKETAVDTEPMLAAAAAAAAQLLLADLQRPEMAQLAAQERLG